MEMLEETEIGGIGIGDTVKSFDFEGRDDCYIEGTIAGFTELEGCRRYVVKTTKRVFGDEVKELVEDHPEKTVYPPLNGTPSAMGGETNFVKLTEKSKVT